MQKRVEALDGVRGVAIALVMAYHLFTLRYGWAGVDLFFVLSGYLITTILLAERREPAFWRIFYLRRATRIIPAYVVLVIATILLVPIQWHVLWPYYVFFGANLAFTLFHMQVGPLMVLWSLAVEEHFYFVWPTIVRNVRDRTLMVVLACVVAVEPILRVIALHFFPDGWVTQLLTPFCLDGIALGSLLSILMSRPATREKVERVSKFLFPACVACCVLVFVIIRPSRVDDVFFFNAFGDTLIAVSSVSLIAWVILQPQGRVAKLFAWKPLRFLGKISYSLYLYHSLIRVLVLKFTNAHGYVGYTQDHKSSIIVAPIAIVLAWLSFRYFETPFLDFGRRRVAAIRSRHADTLTDPEVRQVVLATQGDQR